MSREASLTKGTAKSLFGALAQLGVYAEDAPRDPGPWRLIACNVRQEKTATVWLRRFGGEVYMPVIWEKVRRSGRVLVPAFRGYLFARIGLLTRSVENIPGVRGTVVLGNCFIVPEAAIAKIREAEVDGVIIETKLRPSAKCQIGNVIRITDGPFCGYPATVTDITKVKIDGAYRIEAEVEIFGRPTPMGLKHDQFEVVALKDQAFRK